MSDPTDIIVQIAIAFTGCTAIYLTQQSNEHLKKFACVLGMVGQPFWYVSAYYAEQWGIMFLCLFYTYSWGLGVWNNWIVPLRQPPKENRDTTGEES